jgi:SAM-dependent methyltransferase
MTLIQHVNMQVKYDQQEENSENYVIPFIEKTKVISKGLKVMEVGCGEGGVMLPFLKRGCECVGVDLDAPRVDVARDFLKEYTNSGQLTLLVKNIYDQDFIDQYKGYFDLIILKDVIEHVPDQNSFIPHLASLLNKKGQIFFGFPPWYMPFGGHQQICEGKLMSKLPYYHILPKPLYLGFLNLMGESKGTQIALEEIWDTSITIGQFTKYVRNAELKILNEQHYLINPIYKYKFGLTPRIQLPLVKHIPYLRNFITTCVYYTIGK